ncbi:hypothetical protein [Luteibacter sp. 9135]|uniref:hypothetical protein n=1 Tax=Luteibacter sp. 9135 TaxID=1500893 RepID=UPI00163B37AD|nr:hypothetical protein [Luteibacter sp. 9135]
MSAIALTPKIIDRLKALASDRVATDNEDFEAYSWCGGNADDAVDLGVTPGALVRGRWIPEGTLAREDHHPRVPRR